jgi:predicted dienelactone hydrolase
MLAFALLGHALLAVTLLFHAGQRPLAFTAQQLTEQAGVPSSTITGVVWYPVAASIPERPQTIGAPGDPSFEAGRASAGAPMAATPKRFALILLSHGTGGSARQLAWLGTALARNGFIAVAIDHPGDNALGEPTVRGFTLWWLRARELSMALDTMLADPSFGPRIDPARIGAAGFSLGGYTAIAIGGARVDAADLIKRCEANAQAAQACQSPPEFPDLVPKAEALRKSDASYANALANSNVSVADPRVRAVYAIAPAIGEAVTLNSLHDIDLPVRIAYGTSDAIAPPPENALRYTNWIPGATALSIAGAGHYTFLDTCMPSATRTIPALCVDAPGLDRNAVHAQVASDAIAFFRRFL